MTLGMGWGRDCFREQRPKRRENIIAWQHSNALTSVCVRVCVCVWETDRQTETGRQRREVRKFPSDRKKKGEGLGHAWPSTFHFTKTSQYNPFYRWGNKGSEKMTCPIHLGARLWLEFKVPSVQGNVPGNVLLLWALKWLDFTKCLHVASR